MSTPIALLRRCDARPRCRERCESGQRLGDDKHDKQHVQRSPSLAGFFPVRSAAFGGDADDGVLPDLLQYMHKHDMNSLKSGFTNCVAQAQAKSNPHTSGLLGISR